MSTRLDSNWISDHVPTYSDEVTRADLKVLGAMAMTTEESADSDEGVFAEATLELFIDQDVTC